MQRSNAMTADQPRAIVVMGVSGSGKSTLGGMLAAELHCPFLEGDSFHPDANVEDALDLMLTKGFRHLPVLDDERLVGVVSLRDLGRYATGDHPT